MSRRIVPLVALAAAAAAFWPAAGNAAGLKGIVVARQHGVLLVASPAGVVRAATGSAAVGSRVVTAGGRATVVGRAHTARVRGVVARRSGGMLFVASNHHLIAIAAHRTVAAIGQTTPGTMISADVGIQNGTLVEEDEDDLGQVAAGTITVQATVAAVGTGTVTLNVQGQMLVVQLPGGLTLPASLVGQTVSVNLSLAQNEDDQGDDDGGGSGSGGGNHGGGDHGGDGDG